MGMAGIAVTRHPMARHLKEPAPGEPKVKANLEETPEKWHSNAVMFSHQLRVEKVATNHFGKKMNKQCYHRGLWMS